MKNCGICNKEFYPTNPRSKYCDNKHYKNCKNCGKKFEIINLYKIKEYCSHSCSVKNPKQTQTCEHCGKEFLGRKNSRYCKDNHYKNCENCGKTFLIKEMRRPSKTCSNTCAAQLSTKNSKFNKTCEICKKDFIAGKKTDRYCSVIHTKTCQICENSFELSSYEYENTKTCSPKCAAKITDFDKRNEKSGQTTKKRYGVLNPSQSEEVRGKIISTIRKKYGVQEIVNISQVPEIKKRIKRTNLEKYGHESYLGSKQFQETQVRNNNRVSKINKKWHDEILEKLSKDFSYEEAFGKRYYADLGYGDILLDINPTVSHNVHLSFSCIVKGCKTVKCDNHPPIDKNLHHQRFLAAEKEGKTYLQYFDWYDKDIFISVLRSKLKLDENKVYARKCKLKEITQKEANIFFNENHLLGGTRGQELCLGLFYNEELVHVQTYGKARFNKNFEWEAIRSCSKMNWHVQGGVSKCDSYFFRTKNPKSVISYVDLTISTGETELSNPGWELLATNKASGTWVNLTGEKSFPTFIKDSTARNVGADRLLGFKIGERFPSHHINGEILTNEDVLLSSGYVKVYDAGTRTFAWRRQ